MIKITKYGHAILMAMSGIFVSSYPWLWTSFVGGLLIGYGLKLARESGEENGTS